ncbi:MAG: hypothetical protein ISS15_17400 [Alphaproteobacteria bacterium]|nr:hypothetical protein [Alphaproteobacteria bacterium]
MGVPRLGLLCLCLTAMLASSPASAAGGKTLRNAGNILLVALPVSAVGISLAHDGDWKGLGQFALAAGLTVGSAYALRAAIRIRRPDHSDFNSFSPPDVALADSSASYLWQRYGWKYGVLAYAARAVVSYALSDAKKNHWYDTLASSALSFGFNYAIVTRYHPNRRYNLSVDPEPGGGAAVHFTMNF